MLFVTRKNELSLEYWDGLQSKEALYNEFDKMDQQTQAFFDRDPNMPEYYKDGEFKAVANSVKDSVEKLLAVLPDIMKHFAEGFEEQRKGEAEKIISELNLETTAGMAACAWLVYTALDTSNENSFIKRVESGNKIPEERAAYRAYARYKALKAEDNAKLEAFKKTPEYKMQAMEIKLGLRNHIELPESEDE